MCTIFAFIFFATTCWLGYDKYKNSTLIKTLRSEIKEHLEKLKERDTNLNGLVIQSQEATKKMSSLQAELNHWKGMAAKNSKAAPTKGALKKVAKKSTRRKSRN